MVVVTVVMVLLIVGGPTMDTRNLIGILDFTTTTWIGRRPVVDILEEEAAVEVVHPEHILRQVRSLTIKFSRVIILLS